MNDKIIYPLEKQKSVIVTLVSNKANIVVTDGFHFTYPYIVEWYTKPIQHLKISCTIEDEQLIIGLVLILLFYSAALTSDIFVLKILSFVPILQFLNLFYIRRKVFLKQWLI